MIGEESMTTSVSDGQPWIKISNGLGFCLLCGGLSELHRLGYGSVHASAGVCDFCIRRLVEAELAKRYEEVDVAAC